MDCRPNCGACCIVPSISTKTLLLPEGKAAMEPCRHLDDDMKCLIFTSDQRPKVCANLKPSDEMCGKNREEAMAYLTWLEFETR